MNEVIVKKVSQKEELQAIFRHAQAAKTPVSAYRKPLSGEISLDFSNWKAIENFDVDNLMVIAPPGIILKDLNIMATAKGLRFIPADTPLLEDLSIGEWAYRGCPNPSSWKYGAGKHFLLGATYVFPNGEIAPAGGKCIKNVTGYDFTRFFTGAYADLAVGVQYIIKLMPQTEYRHRYDVTFSSLEDVMKFVSRLQSRSVPPAWLFWFDEVAGSSLFAQQQRGQRVIFEFDGNEAEVRSHVMAIDKLLVELKGYKAAKVSDLPNLSHIEERDEDFWLLDELKLSYPSITALADRFAGELLQHRLNGGLFGQLADGKIHLYLNQSLSPTIRTVIANLQAETESLGGAASGKYARLYGIPSSNPLDVLETTIKKCLDPELIFNRREG